MTLLTIGLVVFFAVHALPWLPPLRAGLLARLGARGYQALFALLSLLGLVLIVMGYGRAEFVALYSPPGWGPTLTRALMLPAAILLVAAYAPGNVRRYTRHPMLWGVSLWSAAHLLANGDLASLLLFGSFGSYALLDMVSANRRGARKAVERLPWSRDAFAVVIGLVVYSGLLRLHPFLFGVPAIG